MKGTLLALLVVESLWTGVEFWFFSPIDPLCSEEVVWAAAMALASTAFWLSTVRSKLLCTVVRVSSNWGFPLIFFLRWAGMCWGYAGSFDVSSLAFKKTNDTCNIISTSSLYCFSHKFLSGLLWIFNLFHHCYSFLERDLNHWGCNQSFISLIHKPRWRKHPIVHRWQPDSFWTHTSK